MQKVILVFVLVLSFFTRQAIAQSPEIDSIKLVITRSAEDSNKVDALLRLSTEYFSLAPDESILYAKQAQALAIKIKYARGEAYAHKNMGIAYYMQGKYLESIDSYEASLKLFDSLKDKNGIANILSNEGAVYFNQADDEKALELYLKSLRYSEQTGDTLRILTALQNIGAIYFHKPATFDKALTYFLRALPMSEAIRNQDAIGTITVNLGEIYLAKGRDQEALSYFKRSLVAYKGSPNIPYSLNDIGKVYQLRKDYATAIRYHEQALSIATRLNAKVDMAQSLLGLGEAYQKQEAYKKSLEYYQEAEQIGRDISNANYELQNAYAGQAIDYSMVNDFASAFRYETLYSAMRDSLYNIDVEKKMSGLQFNFDIQKKQGQIDLLKKDEVLQQLDLNRQKFAKKALLVGLSLVFMIAIILYRNYRNKLKINKILDSQKAEIETLLLNILPSEVAGELQKSGTATPKYYEKVSVLFTDFKDFTKLAEKLSPQEIVTELNTYFMVFDDIIEKYHLEKIKTIGDSYMCAGGIPVSDDGHILNIIRAGIEIQEFMTRRNEERARMNQPPWIVRIGINTGPLVAGVVGKKKYAYDIWGSTVNIASRMESNCEPGRINISAATYELVKSVYRCTHRGKIFAKNIGEVDMYFVENELEVGVGESFH